METLGGRQGLHLCAVPSGARGQLGPRGDRSSDVLQAPHPPCLVLGGLWESQRNPASSSLHPAACTSRTASSLQAFLPAPCVGGLGEPGLPVFSCGQHPHVLPHVCRCLDMSLSCVETGPPGGNKAVGQSRELSLALGCIFPTYGSSSRILDRFFQSCIKYT